MSDDRNLTPRERVARAAEYRRTAAQYRAKADALDPPRPRRRRPWALWVGLAAVIGQVVGIAIGLLLW